MSGFEFRAKRRVAGVYFNDGLCSMSVEPDKEHRKNPDPKLIRAIRAAWKTFNRVYVPKRASSHLPKRSRGKEPRWNRY